MAQSIEERLLNAIEKDDIKTFNVLMDEAQCGGCRLGRFPVLSLLYLYNSRKIISAHEQQLSKISVWRELREPASVIVRFSEKAGKCVRLYFSEVVSPLEMLLILDKTRRLKKIYSSLKPSEAVKGRLKSIYFIKYSLDVKFDGNEIILDRRPLKRREKQKIISACFACVLILAIIVATPVTTVALVPKRSKGEVTKFSQIDFTAQKTYTLKNDISIPENFSVKNTNCTIIGGGKKLVFAKNATLGEFNGKMSNLEIETSGSPIFTVCNTESELSDITVAVNADFAASEDSAFIAVTNYGTFDGVTVNVSGKVSAQAGENETDGLIFGGMVVNNSYLSQNSYGVIKNCTVNYSDFSLVGEIAANATFGGIVGINRGIVQGCTVTGDITADTFDLAGVCYGNASLLSGIVNEANLSQTSADEDWSPIVSGIVVENASVVEYCKNTGNLTVAGLGVAISGGIAARTYGQIGYCISSGNITVRAQTAHVGCIFGQSEVVTSGWYVYCGFTSYCIGTGKIYATLGDGASCVGGIGGLVQEQEFVQNTYDENGNAISETVYFGGGVSNCIFLGEIDGRFDYFGNIVGVCGANIYEKNSYISGNTEYLNFDGNYYRENALPAFGAVVAEEDKKEIFTQVKDKGASAATENEIKNNKTYKDILKALGM